MAQQQANRALDCGQNAFAGLNARSIEWITSMKVAVVTLTLLLSTPLSLHSAQDYIKENPALDQLLVDSSPQDRDRLNRMLSTMSADDRQRYIQGMIDFGLKIQQNAIVVERVFAKFHKAQSGQKGLIVSNKLPTAKIQPVTPTELNALAKLPLNGTLEIVQMGRGGVKGAKKEVRILLIMQKPVTAAVEFALPVEGSLAIVQIDDVWTHIPKDYIRSDNKITIKPGRPDKTDVEYDDGAGRSGSEVYSWAP